MSSRWFYADEKLSRAIRLLTVLPGDARARLEHAFAEFHPLTEEDFPPKLQRHYKWVMKALTKKGPVLDQKGEVMRGSLEHTLKHMRKSTAAKIAERLWMLHDKVDEALRADLARPLTTRSRRTRATAALAVDVRPEGLAAHRRMQ
jgi:hypothetical protein